MTPVNIKDPNTKAMLDARGIQYRMKCDSRFMKFLGALLYPFNRRFMTSFTTIFVWFGKVIIFFPENWESLGVDTQNLIIAHELIHLKQNEKYGLMFKLLYFILPLPILFTFRYYFEREAYLLNYRKHPEWLEYYVDFLTGPDYLWAGKIWPGRIRTRRWFLERR